MGRLEDQEEAAVRQLGDAIGYGRMMQLAEQMWRKKLELQGLQGGEHTTGPCATFMRPCPHPELDGNGHCTWCCGAGRLTQRVAEIAALTKRQLEQRQEDDPHDD